MKLDWWPPCDPLWPPLSPLFTFTFTYIQNLKTRITFKYTKYTNVFTKIPIHLFPIDSKIFPILLRPLPFRPIPQYPSQSAFSLNSYPSVLFNNPIKSAFCSNFARTIFSPSSRSENAAPYILLSTFTSTSTFTSMVIPRSGLVQCLMTWTVLVLVFFFRSRGRFADLVTAGTLVGALVLGASVGAGVGAVVGAGVGTVVATLLTIRIRTGLHPFE